MSAGQPVKVEVVREVTSYRLSFTPGQANALYNDIYCILRDRGISTAHDRPSDGSFTAIFNLYDGLYQAGVDGSG